MVFLAAIFVAVFYLNKALKQNPPGYCKAQERYISDEEFIKSVIPLVRADIARRKPQKGDSSFYADWNGYVPEIDDINCCVVNRTKTESIANRIFGKQEISISMSPQFKDKSMKNAGGVSFYFDVCRDLRDSDIHLPFIK